MKQFIVRLVREDQGQDLIEYALLASLIAIAAIAAMQLLGPTLNTKLNEVNTALGS